jgi:NitT/TauT family transport system permease protein
MWGEAWAFLYRPRRFRPVDLVIVVGVAGFLYGLIRAAHAWAGEPRPAVEIDLSPWALPAYTLQSLGRGLLAYVLSLLFTLGYGYWAAKDRAAERVLIPMLDILQSIPVLGFMPGLVLALVAAFPRSNAGLELATVLMIFTGQAWNMTFSFYHSVSSVPADMQEVAAIYRFTPWQRLRWTELPYATMGLVWNSMMSMAGGWFFLMICEAFRLGETDFRLPGIGSYMSVAVDQGRVDAMLWAVLAMVVMIVVLDQLLWRPVVVWAQKFRVEEGGAQPEISSWFLGWLRHSGIVAQVSQWAGWLRRRIPGWSLASPAREVFAWRGRLRWLPYVSHILLVALLAVLAVAAWKFFGLLRDVSADRWMEILKAAVATLGRVMFATALGTLWTVPAGLAIGLSPRLSRFFQPIVQVVASFPAPMLYPIVIGAMVWCGVTLDWGSIVMMLLGTQWYILFNVIAGAMAVPADLREAARSYQLTAWQRFTALYLPAIFPYLVTGWVTAAGGAWNASIVAEYVTYRGEGLRATGLGALVNTAAAGEDFPRLAACILVMSAMVVLFNRLVWRPCYRLAQTRLSLSK